MMALLKKGRSTLILLKKLVKSAEFKLFFGLKTICFDKSIPALDLFSVEPMISSRWSERRSAGIWSRMGRRQWVWARLDQSPLAMALQHLYKLAQVTQKALSGTSVETIVKRYVDWGWQADAAMVEALQAVEKAEDVAAVKAAIVSLYRPWQQDAVQTFQRAMALIPAAPTAPHPLPEPDPGTCVIFCDALRFDARKRLQTLLDQQGLNTEMTWRMAALPPVTPTAKPAVSPVADRIAGNGKQDLIPVVREIGANVTAATLRNLLSSAGYQILADDELGDPAGRAWTEFGAIDVYGHEHGWKIAHHLRHELERLAERVQALLQHGWRRVLIVTDHGWLMLPGGLPKADLPLHLTHLRKGRCAVLKKGLRQRPADGLLALGRRRAHRRRPRHPLL